MKALCDFYEGDRADAYFIRCTDGSRLEVHPAYNFSTEEWNKIPHKEKERLTQMRRDYKKTKQEIRQASQVRGYYHPYSYAPPPYHYPPPHTTARDIKETRTEVQDEGKEDKSRFDQSTIMGGRKEQARLRGNNPNNLVTSFFLFDVSQ